MARVTVEDCLRKVSNRFLLVHLGAKRVIQLRKGATPYVEAPKNKEVVLALREIAAGQVSFDNIARIDQIEAAVEAPDVSVETPKADAPVQEAKEDVESSEEESRDIAKVEQEDSSENEAR